MNRGLAEEIHKHLLSAAALRRAERAGHKLRTKREQRAFMELLLDVTMPLHFHLLRALYREHPELRPTSRDPPQICSTLRWEDVSLPKSVSQGTSTRRFLKYCPPIAEGGDGDR